MKAHIYSRVCLLVVLISSVAFSQSVLKGTVTDATTGDPLIGANVVLVGTSLGAATDLYGSYRIVGIPAGGYTVRVSYVGYEAQKFTITISEKEHTLDVKLSPEAIEGEVVEVYGQLRGQMAAINQQITSQTIVNVVSEEKIKELPDANAAEAIGRLPGVSVIRSGGEATKVVLRGLSSKFSNITVDGVRIPPTDAYTREVDLSTISQGSLAGIELYKTLTPDQDGDAIAGTVNLKTKKAPSEREITLDVKGDYNHLMNSLKQYDVMLRYGERFFDDVMGIQIQGNIERKIRSSESIAYGYAETRSAELPTNDPNPDVYWLNNFNVYFNDEVRKRSGAQVILDVNTPDEGNIKLSAVYSGTNRDIMSYNRQYPTTLASAYFDFIYRYRELDINTVNSSLQGQNHLLGFTVDWNASYAHSRTENPYDYQLRFTDPSGGSIPPAKDHPEINIIPYASTNYSAAACSTALFRGMENFEKERTASINLLRKYAVSEAISGEFKFGGKYKTRDRWFDSFELYDNAYLHSFYFNNVDGTPKAYQGTRFEDYVVNRSSQRPALTDFYDELKTRKVMDLYTMAPLIEVDALKEWYELNKNGAYGGNLEYSSSAIPELMDYSITERVSSGYVMNTLNYGQSISFLLGARIEKDDNDYYAKYAAGGVATGVMPTVAPGAMRDSTAKFSKTIVLPNAQLTVRPTDYLTLRLVAYKALARPDYNLRLPRFYIQGNAVEVGNPNLKNIEAWNFEINTQIYENKLGLISASVFYKRIDNLIHDMEDILLSGNANQGSVFDSVMTTYGMHWNTNPSLAPLMIYGSHTLSAPYNSKDPSYAYGAEFEHQFNLNAWHIPAWLRNITLTYNFSITRSETNILIRYTKVDTLWSYRVNPRTGDTTWVMSTEQTFLPKTVKRQSEGQPKFYGNIALGYDIKGFSARLSVFYQDKYVEQYSEKGNADEIVDSFTKWDLSLKQVITNYLSVFVNVNNLTNIKETKSRVNNIRGWNLPRSAEFYGTTIDFGVRVSL
jgi:TonB-dependent receptor